MKKNTPLCFLSLLAMGLSAGVSQTADKNTHPNVLFVVFDDLNDLSDVAVSAGGHPQHKTPNLDRFIKSAVRFNNAHCAVPVCGPSRAAFLSGLSPVTTGYYGWGQSPRGGGDIDDPKATFERPVLKDSTCLPQQFAQHGYTVFGTGKISHDAHRDAWMFDNADGRRNWGFAPVSQGPNASDGNKGSNGRLRGTPTTNFMPRELESIHTFYGPLSNVPDIPADPKKGTPGYKGWVDFGLPFRYVNEEDRDLMTDEKSAIYAVDVLKQKHEKPFFLAVGFCKPHEPLVAPKKYFDLFKDVEIELPPHKEHDLDDCIKALWENSVPHKDFLAVRAAGIPTWKEWIRAYLACAAYADDQFGRIMSALEASPYADNTIIIVIGDNGMHLGQKDMLSKMTLWKESTRVPLIMRLPKMTTGGRVCNQPVSLIDLYPTLDQACGLPSPKQTLDGFSLLPLIEDPSKGHWAGPDAALIGWMGKASGEQRKSPYMKADAQNQNFAIVTNHCRYIRAYTAEEELYDHTTDPNEWTNLAAKPEFQTLLGEMRSRLEKQLAEHNRQ